MSEVQFEIAFEGTPFDGGEIDVIDLAPTLLAFGAVIQAASKALNGDQAEAKLKVSATERGSFAAILKMDVSWANDMLDAITANPERVKAAQDLFDLLIDGGTIAAGPVAGAIAAIVLMKGKRPE